MEFVKAHLWSLVAAVVALAAVGIGVVGMNSDAVHKEMDRRIAAAGEINSLQSDPKNEDIIAAEKKRGELIKDELARTEKEAARINKRDPLMTGLFPTRANESAPFEFKRVYALGLQRLPQRLLAGDLPTQAEIADEQQNIDEMVAQEQVNADDAGGGATTPPLAAGGARSPGGPVAAPSAGGPGAAPSPTAGSAGRRAPGVVGAGAQNQPAAAAPGGGGPAAPVSLDDRQKKYSADFRAWVNKAKSIRLYANANSFHVAPLVESTAAPTNEQMWFAQMSYWVQSDVVDAIAALNNDAAKTVTEGDACVEQMPVKRIERIRVWGYQTKAGLVEFPVVGMSSGNEMRPSFTGRVCDDQLDVVRFTVTAIIDQRDLLKLIDRLNKQNFYQCLYVESLMVSTKPGEPGAGNLYIPEPGYMFGSAPCVRVILDFEGYFTRKAYLELMPNEVKALLGVQLPQS